MYRKHLLTVWENENFHFWPTDRKRESERDKPWDGNCWNASPFCLAAAKLKLWPNVVAIIFIDFLYILTYFYLVWSASSASLSPSLCCFSCCFQLRQRKEGSKTLLSIIIYYCFVASFVHRRFVFSHFGIYFRSVWKNEKRKHWRRIQRKNEMRRRRAWAITCWDDWMKIAFICYWCHYARSRKKLTKSNQKQIHIYLI